MLLSDASRFLTVFVVFAFLGLVLVRRFSVSGVKRFELVLSYLGGVSALLIAFNIYITIQSNNRIEKNRVTYNTIENIRNNFLEPQREIIDHYPETYFLYASMYQDTDLSVHAPEKYDPIKRNQAEIYFSVRVFQTIEDFLSTAQFDITGIYVWVNNFLMWMQSPILQKNWDMLAFNYAEDTRVLVGRIVEKANELITLRKQKGKLTSLDYDTVSKSFALNYKR